MDSQEKDTVSSFAKLVILHLPFQMRQSRIEAVKTVKRAYKYRFYPTGKQKMLFGQTFGCVRFVYN